LSSNALPQHLFRVAALTLACGVLPLAAHAQAKPAVRHTVEGTVIDGAKAPVVGAVVYLENPKSLDVQSYLTDAKGYFHFSQISPQTDYEVWAEQNGVETKHKFISQFSNHVHFKFILKLTPEKKKKFLGIF
jgi:protocatechuate 3,4-dioxygenase beta subunit